MDPWTLGWKSSTIYGNTPILSTDFPPSTTVPLISSLLIKACNTDKKGPGSQWFELSVGLPVSPSFLFLEYALNM